MPLFSIKEAKEKEIKEKKCDQTKNPMLDFYGVHKLSLGLIFHA
jgi:hypothetical protein